MQPTFQQLPLSKNNSFLYLSWECKYFDKPWHFHKEYELVLINEGQGTRFIGDNVHSFRGGDLIFIGPNVPHLFRNSEDYYKKEDAFSESIFIHFAEDAFGKQFFDLQEMTSVRNLLELSSLGLEVHGRTNNYVKQILFAMKHESPDKRLISLLNILVGLSTSQDLKSILTKEFINSNAKDTNKINSVLQFILSNYTKEIYLEEIAIKFNMSTASFSRYFKQHTRKTFSDYVTEVRISHACRLLIENNYNISEIGYLSGFENLSNYYRHFKKYLNLVPKEYQKRFLSNACK
ncbi:MAG: AraC family transcriptional regulator [Ginsengibacter sp.]